MTSTFATQPDVKGLKALYKGGAAASAILDHFASRERNWTSTAVDRLMQNVGREGKAISRGEAIEVLKKLADLGCGSFVVGRRGRPSRFEWSVGMVGVGKAAAGESVEIEEVSQDDPNEETSEQSFPHRFQLRPDFLVEVSLPGNLTNAEASRLADYIRTLPFDRPV